MWGTLKRTPWMLPSQDEHSSWGEQEESTDVAGPLKNSQQLLDLISLILSLECLNVNLALDIKSICTNYN